MKNFNRIVIMMLIGTTMVQGASLPKSTARKPEILAESLVMYAQEGSKALNSIPTLEEKAKRFIDESSTLLARLKNDTEKVQTQIAKLKRLHSQTRQYQAVLNLIQKEIAPQLNHLAQLALSGAEFTYEANNLIVQPFNNEVAHRAMKNATEIRNLARAINALSASLQEMSKQIYP